MCTRHVAGNTQRLVSMGKLRKMAMGLSMQLQECMMISRYHDEVTVDDDSFAKMSGGDVDVEPYLNSRYAIGHGNRNSNSQSKNMTKLLEVVAGRLWWCYAEVVVVCGSGSGHQVKI